MAIFPSPRIRLHEVFVRSKAATTTLTVYEDGAAVVPTSATLEMVKPGGASLFGPASASISGGGEISYAVSALQLPSTLELSDAYMLHWVVTIDGVEHDFKRPAAIALSRLYPVISDLDLQSHYSDLASIRPSSLSSYQNFIDESFILIVQRIRDMGNFEYLILDAQSLRAIHLDLCFYLIWKDMDSSGLGEGRYLNLAQEHRRNFEAGFKQLRFSYDLDQDNAIDSSDDRRAASPVIYTSAPPAFYLKRW